MSTLKVNKIENVATTAGGISIDNTGHAMIDGMQMPTAGAFSNRNVIINPEMKINQRGGTVTGDGDFPVDRWRVTKNDHGAYSGTQSADHPPGFGQSIQISCATAKASLSAGSNFVLFQRIEGFNVQPFAKALTGAKPFSVSFWFKTNKTGNYAVILRDIVNNRSVSHMINVTASATWVEYSHTFPADATGGWPSSNTNALEFQLWLCAGTNFTSGSLNTTWNANTNANMAVGQVKFFDSTSNECFLTGVQLEVGEMATPFEHRNYGDELAKCQRYYQVIADGDGNPDAPISNPTYYNATQIYGAVRLPVEMRSPPSLDQTTGTSYYISYSNSTNQVTTGMALYHNSNTRSVEIQATLGSAGTAGQSSIFRVNHESAYVAVSAEL